MIQSTFWSRLALHSLAIVVISSIIPGIELNGILAAVAAGAVFGLVNSFIKPLLVILTLPLTLLTFGIFLLVINGLSFWLVAGLVKGYYISNILSAIAGAFLMSLFSILINAMLQKHEPKNMHVGYFR
ncbi:MAG TPA: phage holin family protein [Oligoflexia bacterium]|nr:phage holin family protein [Oligoflexia bacterium]HMR25406.1 phage holin family protein [Oligoflexia bacterium]